MKLFTLSFFVFLVLLPRSVQDPIPKLVEEDLEYLVNFYKDLHRSPELSLYEKETSKKLAAEMRSIGFEVTQNFGGYGIVCILENGPGPTLLYRTDMDGLPIVEKTALPYASTHSMENGEGTEVNTMHACGHDMHMTVWLGTARAMVKARDKWKGKLIFIGQPAEEIGAGAAMMLDAGLYEEFGVPDYGIGLHASPDIPAGQVGFGKGHTMATAESVDIKVFGYGAHGASPHKSVDPVVLASFMVMELQTIVSRNIDPIESVVVTVGAIHGGTKHNIIPDEVELQLTLRTFKKEVRDRVHKRIKEIAKGVAIAAGLPEEKYPVVSFPEKVTPPNYNHPDLVDKMVISASKAIGSQNVLDALPQMVAEDFANYGNTIHRVPTVLFWLGTVPKDRMDSAQNGMSLPALHSPFYYPDPVLSVKTGVLVTSRSILDLLHAEN